MANKMTKDFFDKKEIDIKTIPTFESDISFEYLQKEIADKNSSINYLDNKDGLITILLTIDNFNSYMLASNLGLISNQGYDGAFGMLISDNKIPMNFKENISLTSSHGGEKKDNASGKTYREEMLYIRSNISRYDGYIPDEDKSSKLSNGYFLGEIHNDTGVYSMTYLFNISRKTKIIQKKIKTTAIKDIYIDSEQFKIVEACYELKKPCLFMGPTGCGKTTIVRELSKQKKHNLVRINLNGEITKEDLVGSKTLVDGNVKWIDGPLTQALRDGSIILLDELNAALPEVLLLLQSLTETHEGKLGDLRLNENNGEVVKTNSECRIFGTGNPSDEYIGTKDFNPATLSRWIVLNIEYLKSSDEIALLTGKFRKKITDLSIITKLVNLATKLREIKNKDELTYSCSTRDLEQVIELHSLGIKLDACMTVGILNKAQSKEDKEVIFNTIKDMR